MTDPDTIGANEPPTLFQQDGPGRYVPSGWGRGPWDRNAMHGGATGALLTQLADRHDSLVPMRLVRLSFDILKPVPLAPLDVSTQVEREGKRVQVVRLDLTADGVEVMRLRALRIRTTDQQLPDDLPGSPTLDQLGMPQPDDVEEVPFPFFEGWGVLFAHAMEMRPIQGGLMHPPGLGMCWWRLRLPVIDDQEPTPTARLVATADFGNGLAAPVPFAGWLYVNADLQVMVQREPVDDWIGMVALSLPAGDGTALTTTQLADRTGQVGTATQSLYVEERAEALPADAMPGASGG